MIDYEWIERSVKRVMDRGDTGEISRRLQRWMNDWIERGYTINHLNRRLKWYKMKYAKTHRRLREARRRIEDLEAQLAYAALQAELSEWNHPEDI